MSRPLSRKAGPKVAELGGTCIQSCLITDEDLRSRLATCPSSNGKHRAEEESEPQAAHFQALEMPLPRTVPWYRLSDLSPEGDVLLKCTGE